MAKKLTLIATVSVEPSKVDAYLEALRPCWQGIIGEPECLFFDLWQDPAKPGTFKMIEVWSKDKEWFTNVRFPMVMEPSCCC